MPGVAGYGAAAGKASYVAAPAEPRATPPPAAPPPPHHTPAPPPPAPPPILIGGPARLPPPSQLGVGQWRPALGSAVQPALGLGGRLPHFTPAAPAVGLSAPAITPASVPIGRYLGGRVFGPPIQVLNQPPVQRAITGTRGLPLFTMNAWPTPPAMSMAAAAVSAAQNVASAALTQALGTPTQRVLGGPVTLAWPSGMTQIVNMPNAVVRNQAAIVRGVTVMPNLQGLPLTQYVNAVNTPVVMRTTTSTAQLPTTVLFRRMVNNLSTIVRENTQGGVTISGPQGTVFMPAQQLLTAAA